jgi:hypothetical protein
MLAAASQHGMRAANRGTVHFMMIDNQKIKPGGKARGSTELRRIYTERPLEGESHRMMLA